MPRETFEPKLIGIRYRCDACFQGEMVRDGVPFISETRFYFPHRCTHCGARSELDQSYPTISFEPVKWDRFREKTDNKVRIGLAGRV